MHIARYIPKQIQKSEFRTIESSRDSTIESGFIFQTLTHFRSLNPGALNCPKYRFLSSIGYCPIFLLQLFVVGCTVGPKYEPPVVETPCEWQSPVSTEMCTDSPNYLFWWESLNDPMLDNLIAQAYAQNLDLSIAITRVLEARTMRKSSSSAIYPHLDGSFSYSDVKYKKLLNELGIENSAKKNGVGFFEYGFDMEWEIDLFGKSTHDLNGLIAQEESSQASYDDVWITLVAEIARNYVELRGYQLRLESLTKSITSQQDAVNLTQGLLTSGMTSPIEFNQSEADLFVLMAQKPMLELSVAKAMNRLSILVGKNPGELTCFLSAPTALPKIPEDMPIGIPSELLRRRPDIRKAERNLAAATESVGSAIAELFPRLSLRGFFGDVSRHLGSFHSTWFAGPQLLLPIFNSKLITQDVNINKIKVQQALYEYQKAVLNALEETENAIATFHYDLEKNNLLEQARKAHEDAHQLTMQLNQNGFKDSRDVAATNRAFLAAEDVCIQNQIELLSDYISLYKALGGGWDYQNSTACDRNDFISTAEAMTD